MKTIILSSLALLGKQSTQGFNYHGISKYVSRNALVNNISFVLPKQIGKRRSRLTSLFGNRSSSSSHPDNNERGSNENYPLQPIKISEERRNRIKSEKRNLKRFLQGDELIDSRNEVVKLQTKLKEAIRDLDVDTVQKIRGNIAREQQKDAEHVYKEALHNLEDAKLNGSDDLVSLQHEVIDARKAIPHFQLEGMWVGKYGSHGYEMINVTYVEDTLVAYKVTGDKNVPKGEITFKAYLGPGEEPALAPIELTDSASKQWGVQNLIRFTGEGQVAAEGFQNAQFMEGQLIIVGEYFSFAWVPIGHQIFFGRPSPELVLKLLKQSREATPNADVNSMREFAMRCLEETENIEQEECILHHGSLGFEDTDLDECFQ